MKKTIFSLALLSSIGVSFAAGQAASFSGIHYNQSSSTSAVADSSFGSMEWTIAPPTGGTKYSVSALTMLPADASKSEISNGVKASYNYSYDYSSPSFGKASGVDTVRLDGLYTLGAITDGASAATIQVTCQGPYTPATVDSTGAQLTLNMWMIKRDNIIENVEPVSAVYQFSQSSQSDYAKLYCFSGPNNGEVKGAQGSSQMTLIIQPSKGPKTKLYIFSDEGSKTVLVKSASTDPNISTGQFDAMAVYNPILAGPTLGNPLDRNQKGPLGPLDGNGGHIVWKLASNVKSSFTITTPV